MKKAAFIIFLTALIVRLVYIAAVPPRSMSIDDSGRWNQVAVKFAGGEGFLKNTDGLDPKRPPVYPLFLAANYKLFGMENFRAAKISQAFLGALTCVMLFYLGNMLLGPETGLWSGIACSFYPPLIAYCEILQSETVFTFLFLAFLMAFSRKKEHKKAPWFFMEGLIYGVSNLCKGTVLLLPAFLVFDGLTAGKIKESLKEFFIIIFIGLVVIAPWAWRNHKLYGGLMPISSGGAEMLWFGTLPWQEQRMFGNAPAFKDLEKNPNPVLQEKIFKDKAVSNILSSPAGYCKLCVKKFLFFLFKPVGAEMLSARVPALGFLSIIIHLLIILAVLFGMFRNFDWKNLSAVYIAILYFVLIHTILAPEPRYRLPIEPLLLMLAVKGILPKRTSVNVSLRGES